MQSNSGCDYANSDMEPNWSESLAIPIMHYTVRHPSALTGLCDCAAAGRDVIGRTVQLHIPPCCAGD